MATNRTVNIRFLAILVGVLAVLGPSVYFVNAYQVRRHADALKRRADQALREEHFADAAKFYHYYLIQHPEDLEARIGWGKALDKKPARTADDVRQAFENFQFVLGAEPNHDDIRRRQVDLALETRQPNEAIVHIQALLNGSQKNDGVLEQQLAMCYVLRGEDDQAIRYYEKAIEHDPLRLTGYIQLANLYLNRRKEPAKASEVKERMLAINGDQWEAHLAAAALLRQQGLADDEEVKKAFELAPDKAETLLEAGATALRQHKLEEARALLERGLKLYPKNPDFYYRLARVEMEDGRPEKAEEYLRRGLPEVPEQGQKALIYLLALVLIQRGDLATAEIEITNLKNRGASEVYVNDLKARVHMKKNEWAAASQLLEGIRLLVAQQPDFALQVEFLLGSCYEHQRLFDRALENYEQALRLKPDSPESLRARRGKAAALLALGKSEEALVEFRQLLPKDPTVALPLAQLLTERNRRLAPDKRSWDEVDKALSYARRVAPGSKEVAIFQAELAQIRKNPREAFEMLKKERDKDPSQPEPWLALIRMAESQQQPSDTLALIAQAEKQLGERVDLRLARARYWLRVGGEAAVAPLAKLEQDARKLKPAEQAIFLTGLADLYLRSGNFQEPKRLLSRLAGVETKNLPVRQALLELAILTGAETELEPLVREIRSIEGEEGTLWRYGEACRIILAARVSAAQGTSPDRDKLTEARALLARVAAQRPKWGRVALREAELSELEGNLQVALDSYQRALNLGEREPVAFRRALYLLYQAHRFREAQSIIAALQQSSPTLPDDLHRLNISMLIQLGNHEAAIEEAARLVQTGSKDAGSIFLYAQALDLAGKLEAAEKAYQSALQAPGTDRLPDIWLQFVRFLVRTGQKAKAEGLVQEAAKKVPPSVLGQCFEALDRPGKAEEQYQTAWKANPGQPLPALRNLVSFYERIGQLEKAEPYLRRLLEPQTKATPTDMETARRALAVILASKSDYGKLQEGLGLLELNAKGGGLSVLDQHAKAKIYAKHPYYWRQAIELFEQLQGQSGGLSLEEQLALASLYEYYGPSEWAKGRRLYRSVLAGNADNPAIIHLCVRSLLRHNDAEDMSTWLDKLQKLDGPQSLRVLEIRVRLLKAQGKLEEGAKLLKEFAERPDAVDANLETAAALLEEFAKPKAAEDLYRKLVERPGRSDKILLLAGFLGRQGRAPDIQEALDLCDKAWQTCAPDKVALIAIAILNGIKTPSPQQIERVERGLMEALRKSPQSLALQFYMAGLRSLERKYDEAAKLYRQIIEQDPRNALARNNLAWLLAAHDGKAKSGEALDLVNQAINLAGPSADLLDTRAFVYLQQGTAEEALKDLKKALEEEALKQNPSPVLYFHLALAQEMLKDPGAAASLRRAQSLKLKVHPLEQQSYDRLLRMLAQT
jgi:tetratricopeptide (TPR) repeat protein